jgi:Raf kinase inhibitor-like YbhB/YbcL family protein
VAEEIRRLSIYIIAKIRFMPASHVLFVTTSASAVKPISVNSPAFANMAAIPQKYTADGANINPPLILGKIPDGTRSLALIVEDPNAPVDTWVHWLVWDILPTAVINEGVIPGVEGLNAFRRHHYHGPCPPAYARHYYFKVYALNTLLSLNFNSTKYEVIKAMKDHVLGYGELVGTYARNNAVSLRTTVAPDIYA